MEPGVSCVASDKLNDSTEVLLALFVDEDSALDELCPVPAETESMTGEKRPASDSDDFSGEKSISSGTDSGSLHTSVSNSTHAGSETVYGAASQRKCKRGKYAAKCPICKDEVSDQRHCEHLSLESIGEKCQFRCMKCFEIFEDDRGRGTDESGKAIKPKWKELYKAHVKSKCQPQSAEEYNNSLLSQCTPSLRDALTALLCVTQQQQRQQLPPGSHEDTAARDQVIQAALDLHQASNDTQYRADGCDDETNETDTMMQMISQMMIPDGSLREILLSASAAASWMTKAKLSMVKLALLDEDGSSILGVGAGSFVSESGTIVTAACVVTRNFQEDPRFVPRGSCVLVGMHDKEQPGGVDWFALARVITPEDLLYAKTEQGDYVDLAVLQITDVLASCQFNSKACQYEIDPTERFYTDAYLEICDNQSLSTGDDLWKLASPPTLASGLVVDRTVLSGLCALLCEMENTTHAHGVSPGSAVLNEAGQLVAVMSHTESYRNINMAHEDHGLLSERVPLDVRWRLKLSMGMGTWEDEDSDEDLVEQAGQPAPECSDFEAKLAKLGGAFLAMGLCNCQCNCH